MKTNEITPINEFVEIFGINEHNLTELEKILPKLKESEKKFNESYNEQIRLIQSYRANELTAEQFEKELIQIYEEFK